MNAACTLGAGQFGRETKFERGFKKVLAGALLIGHSAKLKCLIFLPEFASGWDIA